MAVETELADADEYEVRVYDTLRGRRLVAAVEIISPANKDRPENRGQFVAKCAALLRQGVSVVMVDLVTVRDFNLYAELLEWIDEQDPDLGDNPPAIYAVSCRWRPPTASCSPSPRSAVRLPRPREDTIRYASYFGYRPSGELAGTSAWLLSATGTWTKKVPSRPLSMMSRSGGSSDREPPEPEL